MEHPGLKGMSPSDLSFQGSENTAEKGVERLKSQRRWRNQENKCIRTGAPYELSETLAACTGSAPDGDALREVYTRPHP